MPGLVVGDDYEVVLEETGEFLLEADFQDDAFASADLHLRTPTP